MDETNDTGEEVRSATPAETAAPAATATRPAATASPSAALANLQREQVLARRRTALILLMAAAVATLAFAIIRGSWVLLGLTLVVDVALAVYIAVLLQIKQRQAATRFRASTLAEGQNDEMRIASR